jgi:nitrate/nitrite transport system ATP-binding protein
MEIAQAENVTCLMVTHDVDEALLLSDRVVMLTNGPEAHIGQILTVSISRPRHRLEVVQHPEYAYLRNELLYFLNQQKRTARRRLAGAPARIQPGQLETQTLTLGFVPSADSGPLVAAQQKGLFEKYGLTVNLSPEPSWESLIEGISVGRLEAAQMLACMPLAMTLGITGQSPYPVVTALVLSRNGSAITLNPRLRDAGVKDAVGLSEVMGDWQT